MSDAETPRADDAMAEALKDLGRDIAALVQTRTDDTQLADDVRTMANRAALSATPAPARGREDGTIIDLDRIFWESLVEAAGQSKWIPPEYFANDWVADCREFLINGPEAMYGAALSKPVLSAEVREMVERLQGGAKRIQHLLVQATMEEAADMLRNLERDRNLVFDLLDSLYDALKASGQHELAFAIGGHFARGTGAVGIPEIVGEIVRWRPDGIEAAAKVAEAVAIPKRPADSITAAHMKREIAAAIRALADPDIRLESDYG